MWSQAALDPLGTLTDLLRRGDLTPSFRKDLLEARGWARRNLGDPDGAVVDLEAALELDPANAGTLADLGYILRETDQDRGEEALLRVSRRWLWNRRCGSFITPWGTSTTGSSATTRPPPRTGGGAS